MNGYFTTEYAKSSRAKCRSCINLIEKGSLRLGAAVQATNFTGMITYWYHLDCFFDDHHPNSVSGLRNVSFLRFEDQELLRHKIEGKPLKSTLQPLKQKYDTNLVQFSVTYCKRNVKCGHCKKVILNNEVNILETEQNSSKQLAIDSWLKDPGQSISKPKRNSDIKKPYHIICFGKICTELKYFEDADKLPGFSELKEEDQMELLLNVPYMNGGNDIPKRKKQKLAAYDGLTSYEIKLKEQSDVMHKYGDGLKTMKASDFKMLLTENEQQLPKGVDKIQFAMDIMTFGALLPCNNCDGQFVPHQKGYSCKGESTWSRCRNFIRIPFRKPFEVPEKLREKYQFLKEYQFVPRIRIYERYNFFEFESGPSEDFKAKMKEKVLNRTARLELEDNVVINYSKKKEHPVHIYQEKGEKYQCILNYVSVQTGGNGYYKLQALEADNEEKYWLFRSWGQIGTDRRDQCLNEFGTVKEVVKVFVKLFKEKTGNEWDNRDSFEKQPGKMFLVDVIEEDDTDFTLRDEVPSMLPKAVQDLVNLIYDMEMMKKLMKEFKLDMTKMPLGKISKKQLMEAYVVLKDLQRLFFTGGTEKDFIEGSNKFYTLVPHNFGGAIPPRISSEFEIEEKRQMIDNLMEIHTACSLIKEGKTESGSIVDIHYTKLKSDIEPLNADSEDYQLIKDYINNTHASTHNSYTLKIAEVFAVNRHGESKRFKSFKELHNRKLLWHGSRTTNFAGILSQGLRIAPKEAPTTGYMFGKGIYFADMVSKSANYCCTTSLNNTGLLLLCEVALGDMLECTEARFIRELPEGKHSVKGIGTTQPDPLEAKMLPNGVEVPCGKGIAHNVASQLLYNEYIVYDVAQVNVKYLVKVIFDYRSAFY